MPRSSRRHPLRSLAAISDHAGNKVLVAFVKHNGRGIVAPPASDGDDAETDDARLDDAQCQNDRLNRFTALATSGRFSATELRTIQWDRESGPQACDRIHTDEAACSPGVTGSDAVWHPRCRSR